MTTEADLFGVIRVYLKPGARDATLLLDDTEYCLTPFYLAGGVAMRRRAPWATNPHAYSSQRYSDWDWGHQHESAGLHARVDLLSRVPYQPADTTALAGLRHRGG